MTAKEAWTLIHNAILNTKKQYNISVINLDDIQFDYGILDDEKIEFASYGLEHMAAYNPDMIINTNHVFGALCSLGHERSHKHDQQNLHNLIFEHKLFHYISDNLPHYYHQNKHSEQAYYRNDYNEIHAELNGLKFAYTILSHQIGQEEAMILLKTYVNTKTETGTYYIPNKQYKTCNDIVHAFKQKKNDIMHFDFPFPSVEPVCNPLKDHYESIAHGTDQLAVIAGRVFTARNYEQNTVIKQYDKDFWYRVKNTCAKYPQFNPYINISLCNDYGMTVENDLAEIGINILDDNMQNNDDMITK